MKSGNMQHLDEEQLVQAVVDVTDLPESLQTHLAECGQCLDGKNSFELEMIKLGQKAEQFAPQPQRRIILPVQKSKKPFWNLLDWRNLIAAAATVTAVFILVWGTNMVRNLAEPGSEILTAEMAEAKKLMSEVNTLVDNALPPFYLVLSGEINADYEEEFYQFLIPSVEDKT
ncbi:hypothetical protein D1BOALGB6SA_2235 [Olavius sp. associated proteobacterium Delta 1]|nr:hypothetical protein D1BOALGB6SA_2235 [Olavius sp. associated proteobacterium Delta 1]